MIDVVERLRTTAEMFELADAPRHTVLHMRAAADEIERLRGALGKADACIVVGAKDQARAVIRAALAQEKKDE